MRNLYRLAVAGGGLLAASAAQAITINFIWHGGYTVGASVSASSKVAGQSLLDLVPGSVKITGVYYAYTEAAPGFGNATGHGWLWMGTNLPNSLGNNAAFAFSFSGNNTTDGMNGTSMHLTGLVSPFLSINQTGQLSHTDHSFPNDPHSFTAGGQFSSVPEPASFAVVGVGLIGLIRRRATTLK